MPGESGLNLGKPYIEGGLADPYSCGLGVSFRRYTEVFVP